MDGLPFTDSETLPTDDISSPLPPLTLVNSRPLDALGPFIAPYVPCHRDVVHKSLSFAHVGPTDILVDLGCGDARILVSALESPARPLRCIGVELDPVLAALVRKDQARWISSEGEKKGKLELLEKDMFSVDLVELNATVLILYLIPAGLEKLKANLSNWLIASSQNGGEPNKKRIVTITYSIPDWEPVEGLQVEIRDSVSAHWLFYYTTDSIVKSN